MNLIVMVWHAFLWFFPAGFANMAPVLACHIPGIASLNTPIDFGLSWRGKRIFGDHKTWRGLIVGVGSAGIVATLISEYLPSGDLRVHPFVYGSVLGLGALTGDTIKSFFKRRAGVPSGRSWYPWDQIDYIVGGFVVSFFVIDTTLFLLLQTALLYFLLHLSVSYIGYMLHLKKDPI